MSNLQEQTLVQLLLAALSFLLLLALQSPSISCSPHPGRIGRVFYKEVSKLTPDDFKNMVPTGAEVFHDKKLVHLSYLAVTYIKKREKFQCGKYIPATNSAWFDDDGGDTYYDPADNVKIVMAEPGTIGWVQIDVSKVENRTAFTDSWFDCEGNVHPTYHKKLNTPCRAMWNNRLVPGFVYEEEGVCLITHEPKTWKKIPVFEYLKHTSLGATVHQAVQNGWMQQDHPPE